MEIASRSGGGTDLDLQAETDNKFKFFIGTGAPNVAVSNTVIEIDKWYHVVGTYSAANFVEIYVNAVLEDTVPISITRGTNPNDFLIGQSAAWSGRFFNGVIDEVKIYDRTLSAAEVRAEYLQVSISPSSVVMNVGDSQVFGSSVAGGASPYSYQWYLNGASVLGASGASWTFTPTNSSSFSVYLNVTDAAGIIELSNAATASVKSPPTPTPAPTATASSTSTPTSIATQTPGPSTVGVPSEYIYAAVAVVAITVVGAGSYLYIKRRRGDGKDSTSPKYV
jgi:hypothetical protein